MGKNQIILLLITTVLLSHCGEKKAKPNAIEIQKNELDTLFIDKSSSTLEFERYKVLHNLFEKLKLGKISFNIHASDITTHFNGKLKIDSGFIIYNKKYFEAKCYIKTSQIVVPQITNDSLKLAPPNYLFPQKFPYIEFVFKGNLFPKTQPSSLSLYLTLNDSTGILQSFKTEIERNNLKKMQTSFFLDGKKWKLINSEKKFEVIKDSVIGQLKLHFN